MQTTSINDAEAVIEPFWDPRLSELEAWTVEPGEEYGLRVEQTWCFVTFEWSRHPVSGPVLSMSRTCGVDASGYDSLVLSVMAPAGSIVQIEASTEAGKRRFVAPPAGSKKRELTLDLDGAGRINSIRIEIESNADGVEQGWLNWIGLRNTEALQRHLTRTAPTAPAWEKHLKPEGEQLSFVPTYGLVLDADEVQRLREKHDAMLASGASSPFLAAAAAAAMKSPESMIGDFVNFWGDSRYNRERDHENYLLSHGLNAAVAGILTRDKRLLRLAARYALSIGMCGKWDDGFICFFPGSDFEHRCFVQSLCAYDVAAILDLAGECFTDLGRDFLLRRLAEEGIGSINFITWKHEYIYHCNQLAWFTPGRMLALAVLARHYPRVRPQIDAAYADLSESLGYSILSDGGYVEGPTYFRCVGRDAGLGIYYYSRARGMRLEDAVPEAMRRCGDFGEAMISTDAAADVVPICDARNRHEFLSQVIMARLLPGSAWAHMVRKRLTLSGGWPADAVVDQASESVPMMADAAIAWNLVSDLPAGDSAPTPFLQLPVMGPVVSVRGRDGSVVKLFIQGNNAGAGHTHEDKGSFVLEYRGETLAMDPGTCDYSSPFAAILKNCERHNMLVPFGVHERPHPVSPIPVDVKPVADGDDTSFDCELDVTPGWEQYYTSWHRAWKSSSPEELEIADRYELLAGEGVEFLWQTMLPVSVEGATATVHGVRGNATLQAPEGTVWRVDELPLLSGTQNRLVLRVPGRSGSFSVHVSLAPA